MTADRMICAAANQLVAAHVEVTTDPDWLGADDRADRRWRVSVRNLRRAKDTIEDILDALQFETEARSEIYELTEEA